MLTIHKASAGSGKTYTLTYTYIKMLLGEKDEKGVYRLSTERNRHRATLAITFTNKATDEMKRRIVDQLACLAGIGNKPSPYEADLCNELHTDTYHLRAQAVEALHELLCDFSNFNISTIDSFFQTVLRTFSREAEITGNYEVELRDDYVITVGVNEMLSSVNRATDHEFATRREIIALVSWIKQYINHNISEGKSFNIFNRKSNLVDTLVTFTSKALTETYKINAEAIDAYLEDISRTLDFAKEISAVTRQLEADFFDLAAASYHTLDSAGAIDGMMKDCSNNFRAWAAQSWGSGPGKRIRSSLDDATVLYKKKSCPDTNLLNIAAETAAEAVRVYDSIILLKTLRTNVYSLGVIGEIQRQAAKFKNENNAILLSDTNDILRRIISEAEAPFIYDRLGVRLRHFLIDEFQDTSRLQWSNLRSLIRESLSTDNDNLIIGDEKQSIYRFRNSDPDLIVKTVPEEFHRQSEIRGNNPKENTNWRSSSEVVRFNNTLFSYMSEAKGLTDIYSNVVQRIAHNNLRGYVKAVPYDDIEMSLDMMTEEIVRQLNSGYKMGDIAILVSTNTNGRTVIDYLLRQKPLIAELKDLQIMSDDALTLSSSAAVRIITSVLSYLDAQQSMFDTPDDAADDTPQRLPVATIQSRYYYHLSKGIDKLKAIQLTFSGDGAEGDATANEAADMRCINLPSIVERIINRYLTEDMRESENVYICGFQDVIADFCEGSEGDLHAFMKWWNSFGKDKCALAIPSEVNAIRVMTIHKSKGLEFPCVHVPIVDWSFNSAKNIEWFKTSDDTGKPLGILSRFSSEALPPFIPLATTSSLEKGEFAEQYACFAKKSTIDILNKTYVAFTRAVNELIIGYKRVSNPSDSSVHGMMSISLDDTSEQWIDKFGENRQYHVALASHTDDTGVFTFGQPTSPADDKKQPDSGATKMPAYMSLDNDSIWDLSRIEDLDEMSLPRQKGIILHNIMSLIRTPRDIGRAVKRHAMKGYIADDEIDEYIEIISRALDEEEVKPWFDGFTRLLNERAFIVNNSKGESQRYRPDRVVWRGDGTIDVIDYKFGEEEPKKYIYQVRGYVENLKKMYPGTTVNGYLWYPLLSRITPVNQGN